MKIAVIGGGSTYTPELISGFIERQDRVPVEEIVLLDVDAKRLEIVGEFAKRMVGHAAPKMKLSYTTDRVKALDGAAFVMTQIRVGGQQARHDDTITCLEKGVIGQETTGPAGFAKAMRTVPVMLDYCKAMETLCPDAWMINFTNPSGIVTEAVLKYGRERIIGLCNAPYGMKMGIANHLQVEPSRVFVDYVGLNHFSWVRRILVDGVDRTREVVSKYKPQNAKNIPETSYDPAFWEALGMIPNGYLSYFYLESVMIADLKAQPKTRAQVVMEVEAELLEMYQDPSLVEKPEALSRRGGAYYSTIAVNLVDAITNNTGDLHIVNTRNYGSMTDLPADAAVEVPAVVDASGAHPLSVGAVEPEIRGLLQHLKAYEELTVEAAVHGSYAKALMALVNNPLVPSVNTAKELLDTFIARHGLQLS